MGTPERYKKIVKYKTAYYTFYLPTACAMILSGIANEESLKTAERICMIIGEYFQIQDDVLDCFGDPKVIGKVGTDIQDNKCSWLVVQALERANKEQKKLLLENYGKNESKKVEKSKIFIVKWVYLNYSNNMKRNLIEVYKRNLTI